MTKTLVGTPDREPPKPRGPWITVGTTRQASGDLLTITSAAANSSTIILTITKES